MEDAHVDVTAVEAMQAATAYIQAADQFYASFQRSLDPHAAWTDQNEEELRRQNTQLVTSRSHFAELYLERRRPA